ncbi:MAG TPA: T9SS type A sorting domain-containing protein, partial [Saprospiraceae bacterium]|nr:T9SS type A sorting domain-containing protein [Saprospiraceae bacterium]
EMHIKVNGISGLLQYSVINSLGQVVSHGSMTHETMVNTSSFSPGLYLVRVSFGKYEMMGKVVKE